MNKLYSVDVWTRKLTKPVQLFFKYILLFVLLFCFLKNSYTHELGKRFAIQGGAHVQTGSEFLDGSGLRFPGQNEGNLVRVSTTGKSFSFTGEVNTGNHFVDGSGFRFDGNDVLTLLDSEDWAFDDSDFTIDFRVRWNTIGTTDVFFGQYDNSNNRLRFFYELDALRIRTINGNTYQQSGFPYTPVVNEWYHIALVRSGNEFKVFVNGVQQGSTYINENVWPDIASTLEIGHDRSANRFFDGTFDEFRVTKGLARWTQNFIPPTEPLQRDEKTVLLLHFTQEEFDNRAEILSNTPTPTFTPIPTITPIPTPTIPPIPSHDTILKPFDDITIDIPKLLEDEAKSLDMILLPPGSFMMGSPEEERGHRENEVLHEVRLTKGFYIGKYEVTQAQWHAVMGNQQSYFSGKPNNPVDSVNWFEAVQFCNELSLQNGLTPVYDKSTWEADFTANGFRLPTEAEWEYACRAGTLSRFWYGDALECSDRGEEFCLFANPYMWWLGNNQLNGNTIGPKEVGLTEPNPWGLYDMHGNISEWCNDWAGDYPNELVVDPVGPSSGESRVTRGGHYANDLSVCRSAQRRFVLPEDTGNSEGTPGSRDHGFRIVLPYSAFAAIGRKFDELQIDLNNLGKLDTKLTEVEETLQGEIHAVHDTVFNVTPAIASALQTTENNLYNHITTTSQVTNDKIQNASRLIQDASESLTAEFRNMEIPDGQFNTLIGEINKNETTIHSATHVLQNEIFNSRNSIEGKVAVNLNHIDEARDTIGALIGSASEALSNEIRFIDFSDVIAEIDRNEALIEEASQSIGAEVNTLRGVVNSRTTSLSNQLDISTSDIIAKEIANGALISIASQAIIDRLQSIDIPGILNQIDENEGLIRANSTSISSNAFLIQSASEFIQVLLNSSNINLEVARQSIMNRIESASQSLTIEIDENQTEITNARDQIRSDIETLEAQNNEIRDFVLIIGGIVENINAQLESHITQENTRNLLDRLLANEPTVDLFLPAAFGGQLEAVRDYVSSQIDRVEQAGLNIGQSRMFLQNGNTNLQDGDYITAFGDFSKSYNELLKAAPARGGGRP